MVFDTIVKYNGVYYNAGEDVPMGHPQPVEVKSEEPKVEEKPKATKRKKAE